MPDFNDILHTLKTAIKGEDMRQAIYDGMKMLYENGEPGHVEDDWARAQIAEIIRTRGNLLNLTEVPFTLKDGNDQEVTELYINGQTFTIDKTEFPLEEYKYILVYFKTVSTATPEVKVYNREEFVDPNNITVISSTFTARGNSAQRTSRSDIQEIHLEVISAETQTFNVKFANVVHFRGTDDYADPIDYSTPNTSYEKLNVDAGNASNRLAGSIIKISGIKFDTDANYEEVVQSVSTISSQVTALQNQVNSIGDGMSEDFKQALLGIVSNVLIKPGVEGQDLYDALYASLYPTVEINVLIASYSPSGVVVYDTDSLDSLRPRLTVTAYFSDNTSKVITNYTLYTVGGSLTAGTDVPIVITYRGATAMTTIPVVIHFNPLHALTNGMHTFSSNSRVLQITNGNHIDYTAPNATSDTTQRGAYLNLSEITANDNTAKYDTNVIRSNTIFTIPEMANVKVKLKNIQNTSVLPSDCYFVFALKNGSNNVIHSGNISGTDDLELNFTIEDETPITCVMLYARVTISKLKLDIELYVNGVRWI